MTKINLLVGKIKFKNINTCENIHMIDSIFSFLQNYMVDNANKEILKEFGEKFNLLAVENKELKELVIRRASFSLISIFKQIYECSHAKLFLLDDFRKSNSEINVDITEENMLYIVQEIGSIWNKKVYKKISKLIKIEIIEESSVCKEDVKHIHSISKKETNDFFKANLFQEIEISKNITKLKNNLKKENNEK